MSYANNVYLKQKSGLLVMALQGACKRAFEQGSKKAALAIIDEAARRIGAEAVYVYQRDNCTREELASWDRFYKEQWGQARKPYAQ